MAQRSPISATAELLSTDTFVFTVCSAVARLCVGVYITLHSVCVRVCVCVCVCSCVQLATHELSAAAAASLTPADVPLTHDERSSVLNIQPTNM